MTPKSVADFAAGDGSLLQAARDVWPSASLIGNDISADAAALLVNAIPQARSSVADFLHLEDREKLADVGRIDLIVLNPPFTCRGNVKHPVMLGGAPHVGSKALAFVAHALEFLSEHGELLALVPSSCLTSERDALLLAALRKCFTVEALSTHGAAFRGRAVSVTGIRISRRVEGVTPPESVRPKQLVGLVGKVAVLRGSTPVWKAKKAESDAGIPFLHTTNVSADTFHTPTIMTSALGRMVEGYTIFLPRVGRPSLNKLCAWYVPKVIVSDCLFAIRCNNLSDTYLLLKKLQTSWPSLANEYTGSCAPYLTRARLSEFLATIGYEVDFVRELQTGPGDNTPTLDMQAGQLIAMAQNLASH